MRFREKGITATWVEAGTLGKTAFRGGLKIRYTLWWKLRTLPTRYFRYWRPLYEFYWRWHFRITDYCRYVLPLDLAIVKFRVCNLLRLRIV